MAVICLDPGHGGHDSGAVRDGLAEKALTLDIVRAARASLAPHHRVVLTREGDVFLTLAERRRAAAATWADLFVSVHINASKSPRAQGYEVLVRPAAVGASIALATAILEAFAATWPDRRNRRIKAAAVGVLRQGRPCCLVECLFLSHPEERVLLARPDVRAALGAALARGCAAFARGAPLTASSPAGRATTGKGKRARRAARLPRRRAPRPA